jgi:hypothetical protein
MLGEAGWRHLGLMPPSNQPQLDLLRDIAAEPASPE